MEQKPESKLIKALRKYSASASKPLDDVINSITANTAFKDLYISYMTNGGSSEPIIQLAADPVEKDRKKALCFYTKCSGAVDLINEIITRTDGEIEELLIFFVRLLEGLKSCGEETYGVGYFKMADDLTKYFNLSSGESFKCDKFVTCFKTVEDCNKYTKVDKKYVYFKVENTSRKNKDVSLYLADIVGVIQPGASFKVISSQMDSGIPVITVTFEGVTNEIFNAYKAVTLVSGPAPTIGFSDKPFVASNVKVSDLECHYRGLENPPHESLFDSLLQTKFSKEATTPESNKAATKELMDRCKETIKYLNGQGILKKYGLTEEEAMAITIFTFDYGAENADKNPQRIINQTLGKRNTDGMMAIRMYILHLLSALRKLPQYKESDVLYRGINGDGLNISGYKLGKENTRTWPAFTSAYPDEDSALDFLSGDNQILFEIHGDFCGYNIQDFSIFHEEEVILEPDTTFYVKEQRPEAGYTRIVVEVQKFEKLPLSDILLKFNENKGKKVMGLPDRTKPLGLPKAKKTSDDPFIIEVKKKIFEGILCPTVLKKEDIDELKPYNTYALIKDLIPNTNFSSCMHFCEFLSTEILSNVALFKSELAKSGMRFNIEEETMKFVREYTKMINAIREKVKVASRVELKITFTNTSFDNIEVSKKYAKYAAQQLLKKSNEGNKNYFMYNGAINFRGYHGKTIWITMYVKDGVNSTEVAAWINQQSVKYASIIAEPFELGYMNFFVPFSPVNSDINKMLRAVLIGSYGICPEFVSNYESKARNVREFLICCVTKQSKGALLSKAINFFSKIHPFYESVKVEVNSPEGEFLTKAYGDGFYFTDIALEKDPSGKDVISIILPNSSYLEYFVKIVDPRLCRVVYGYNKPLPSQPQVQSQTKSQIQQQPQQQQPHPVTSQFSQTVNVTRQFPQTKSQIGMPQGGMSQSAQQFGMSQSMIQPPPSQQSVMTWSMPQSQPLQQSMPQQQFNQGWQQQQQFGQQPQQFGQQQQQFGQQQFGQQPQFTTQTPPVDSIINAYYQTLPNEWKQQFMKLSREEQIVWAVKYQATLQQQSQQPQQPQLQPQPQPQVKIQIPGFQ